MGWKSMFEPWKILECESYVLMILKIFINHFKIQTATLNQIGCEFKFDE